MPRYSYGSEKPLSVSGENFRAGIPRYPAPFRARHHRRPGRRYLRASTTRRRPRFTRFCACAWPSWRAPTAPFAARSRSTKAPSVRPVSATVRAGGAGAAGWSRPASNATAGSTNTTGARDLLPGRRACRRNRALEELRQTPPCQAGRLAKNQPPRVPKETEFRFNNRKSGLCKILLKSCRMKPFRR